MAHPIIVYFVAKFRGAELFVFAFVAVLFEFVYDAPAFVPLFALPPAARTRRPTTQRGAASRPYGRPLFTDPKFTRLAAGVGRVRIRPRRWFIHMLSKITVYYSILCNALLLANYGVFLKIAERRGVVRRRIRSRVVRKRVRRARSRTNVRVPASSTDTETL